MESSGRRFEYQPALDGLRAVALLGVVGYHAGIDWLRGGFLGVSTFFTLSGFLITTLLLQERTSTGSIALGSFWERRIRRLLPAAMVTIVATTIVVALVGDASQLDRLRADAFASLFHFSNWRFIAEGDSYGALFQSPSFFRHFWSLAVEEQYYFVVPALLTLALRRGATPSFTFAITAVGGALLVWPAILLATGASTDRVYFGTDGRLGELALGAVLAVWWAPGPSRRDLRRRPSGCSTGPASPPSSPPGGCGRRPSRPTGGSTRAASPSTPHSRSSSSSPP